MQNQVESMELTKCVKHTSFIYAQGLRLALYKGLHATEARPVQKGGCRVGPDGHALWVELAEMLNIP